MSPIVWDNEPRRDYAPPPIYHNRPARPDWIGYLLGTAYAGLIVTAAIGLIGLARCAWGG